MLHLAAHFDRGLVVVDGERLMTWSAPKLVSQLVEQITSRPTNYTLRAHDAEAYRDPPESQSAVASSVVRTYDMSACPACGTRKWSEFSLGPTALRRCATCGLVFESVYGDPADIYVDGYLTGDIEFGLDIMNPLFQKFLTDVGHRRFALVEKVVRPPRRLLDVGCGSGEMLAVAQRRG